MISYVDSSVVLSIALGERRMLAEWDRITVGVTSELTRVECFRSLSRFVLTGRVNDDEHLRLGIDVDAMLWRFVTLPLTPAVLERAATHMPQPLTTLDALHLATALHYRHHVAGAEPLVFATHDHALATAARAHDFTVIGV